MKRFTLIPVVSFLAFALSAPIALGADSGNKGGGVDSGRGIGHGENDARHLILQMPAMRWSDGLAAIYQHNFADQRRVPYMALMPADWTATEAAIYRLIFAGHSGGV